MSAQGIGNSDQRNCVQTQLATSSFSLHLKL